MRLRNEMRVAVPPERTWRALLDLPRVARALPGAAVEPEPVDGAWRGTMTVRLGPVLAEYAGTARLADVDEDERVAGYHVQGREVGGPGTAAATITGRVLDAGGGTRLVVETDLRLTGREAHLGQGMVQDAAAAVLAGFAARLEEEGLDRSGAARGADGAPGHAAPGEDAGEALAPATVGEDAGEALAPATAGADAGEALAPVTVGGDAGEALDGARAAVRPVLERAAFVLAGLAAGLALGRVVWRR
jgi:carbon monoxide dehydrogenase subunit G